MKKISLYLVSFMLMAVLFCSCSAPTVQTNEDGSPILTGSWVQEGKENSDGFQTAYISDKSIEVFWMSDGGDSSALYWSGTYEPADKGKTSYSWISQGYKDRTDTSLLASGDDSKKFTYKDGTISYLVTVQGQSATVTLVPSKKDYSGLFNDGKPEEDRTTVTTTVATTESTTETTTSSEPAVGTRKNPAKFNEPVVYTKESYDGGAVLGIQLTDLIRGEEAEKIILQQNMFNDEAPEGKEYILAGFAVTNAKNLYSEDKAVSISDYDFEFANSGYSVEDQSLYISLKDDYDLSAELYEGSVTSGYVVFLANVGEQCYAVYDDAVWFSLSK